MWQEGMKKGKTSDIMIFTSNKQESEVSFLGKQLYTEEMRFRQRGV